MRWVRHALDRMLAEWMSWHRLGEGSPGGADPFDAPGRKFLHVGCGSAAKPNVPRCFLPDEWTEVRLDIDPAASPDVVASMLDMAPVPDAAVEAVYSSHNVEHLYPHEVSVAFREFLRVLDRDGFLVLTCPDLQTVCRLISEDRLDETAYVSQAGPIAPLDILYGHRPQLAQGNLFMAHRTGFTLRTLIDTARSAGFVSVAGRRRESYLDIWIVATKSPADSDTLCQMLEDCLPEA